MHNPVRTSASWLAGRVLVFLVILVALVAWDAYRDESLLLAALTKGLLPDKELVARLEDGKQRLEASAADAEGTPGSDCRTCSSAANRRSTLALRSSMRASGSSRAAGCRRGARPWQ